MSLVPPPVDRPSWDETWMSVARTISRRSYDPQLQVGCIIVTDDNATVLANGYNGSYKGGPNGRESDVPGQGGMIHAEINALIKCPYHVHGGKVMYVTHSPCRECSKLIINANIARVVYEIPYRDSSGILLLRSRGITVEEFTNVR